MPGGYQLFAPSFYDERRDPLAGLLRDRLLQNEQQDALNARGREQDNQNYGRGIATAGLALGGVIQDATNHTQRIDQILLQKYGTNLADARKAADMKGQTLTEFIQELQAEELQQKVTAEHQANGEEFGFNDYDKTRRTAIENEIQAVRDSDVLTEQGKIEEGFRLQQKLDSFRPYWHKPRPQDPLVGQIQQAGGVYTKDGLSYFVDPRNGSVEARPDPMFAAERRAKEDLDELKLKAEERRREAQDAANLKRELAEEKAQERRQEAADKARERREEAEARRQERIHERAVKFVESERKNVGTDEEGNPKDFDEERAYQSGVRGAMAIEKHFEIEKKADTLRGAVTEFESKGTSDPGSAALLKEEVKRLYPNPQDVPADLKLKLAEWARMGLIQ